MHINSVTNVELQFLLYFYFFAEKSTKALKTISAFVIHSHGVEFEMVKNNKYAISTCWGVIKFPKVTLNFLVTKDNKITLS